MNLRRNAKLALVATALLSSAAGASTNLIVNGSFEDISSDPGIQHVANGSWSVLSVLPGWTTTFGAGIEVRRNVAGAAQNGVQFVELDSHSSIAGKPASYNSNSSMAQSVTTASGQRYTLSFWYSPRPGTAAMGSDTNDLGVYWNGAQLGGTLTGVNNSGSNQWQQYTYTVVGHGLDILSFSALGKQDTYGGSLDNVSLITAVPEPDRLAMLLVGLGMLGTVARRRQQASAR